MELDNNRKYMKYTKKIKWETKIKKNRKMKHYKLFKATKKEENIQNEMEKSK